MPQSITYTFDKLEPAEDPKGKVTRAIALIASTHFPKGTILGQVTATGLYKAYASGNVDGSENPKGALDYEVTTDASGNHFFGAQASSDIGVGEPSAEMVVAGTFLVSDMPGCDDAAIAALGRLVAGADAADPNAILRMP